MKNPENSAKEAAKKAENAEKKAKNAEESLKQMKKVAWFSVLIGLISIIAAIIYPTWTLINDTNIASIKLVENNEKMLFKIENLEKELKNLKNEK